MDVNTEKTTNKLTPKQSYETNLAVISEIVQVDHFSNAVPKSLVDLWLNALDPESKIALPPDVKGFYGGDLKASIPVELAHDCYKYVMYETDKAKVDKYANRMLIVLSLLDVDKLSEHDANLASLALWHKALAQVRIPGSVGSLAETLHRYEDVRPRASLNDIKLPQPGRLKARLMTMVDDDDMATFLNSWKPATMTES